MARRLRIVVSVFFALVAFAFAALWVRSYWYYDNMRGLVLGNSQYEAASLTGRMVVRVSTINPKDYQWSNHFGMSIASEPIDAKFAAINSTMPRFSYSIRQMVVRLGIPHWAPVALAVLIVLAASRIPLQFSLRTMLVATTLIAVVVALAVWLAS